VDQEDDVSNQSSTTLSSTTSNTKRGYDELNPEDELEGGGHSLQNDSPSMFTLCVWPVHYTIG
jgi:hypothetical protein